MTTPSPYFPGPLALGDVFSGVIELYRRQWKLFILIALMPALLVGAALVIFGVVMLGTLGAAAFDGSSDAITRAVVGAGLAGLVLVIAMIAITALQYRFHGMIALGATDVLTGRTPTFGDLWARTRGVALRALGVIFVLGAAGALAYGLVVGLIIAVTASGGGDAGGDAVGAVVLLFVVLTLAAVVAALVLVTRWFYFVPVLAIEGRGGFEALGRSWELTRGAFWRTLGYSFIGSLLVGLPSMAISSLGGVLTGGSQSSADPTLFLGPFLGLGLLSVAVSVVTAPFMELWRAVMYLDQVNRWAAAAPWQGGQPR